MAEPGVPAAPPATIVIFGGAGDMAHRLLLPALYKLAEWRLLDRDFAVVAIDLKPSSDEDYRKDVEERMAALAAEKGGETSISRVDPAVWRDFAPRLHYLAGDFEAPETYQRLAKTLKPDANAIFYLATAPRFFADIIERLAAAGLTAEAKGWRHVVVEKPFGSDLASAQALNRRILLRLKEAQVYRIDHFLGKETVQNIMVLRFANGIFEPLWTRQCIDHVQITAAETVDVGTRGRFYDATGALRDMVPNHMFQMLALTAMETPNSFAADALHNEKAKVIEAIHPLDPASLAQCVARGQYTAGMVEGRRVAAYRDAPDVARDSTTETFVALKLGIDNWRWAGVPFYLRTGKALARRLTEVAIQFKPAPLALFRGTSVAALGANRLILHIDPEHGVTLGFDAKVPGPAMKLGGVSMDFHYGDYFKPSPSTGYETLLYDCMMGDRTLFQRADNVEAGWRAVEPVLEAVAAHRLPPPEPYAAGSEGPPSAASLIARDGKRWRALGR